jgi:hypothetical protein
MQETSRFLNIFTPRTYNRKICTFAAVKPSVTNTVRKYPVEMMRTPGILTFLSPLLNFFCTFAVYFEY